MNIERLQAMSDQELSEFGFFASAEAMPVTNNPESIIVVLFNGEEKQRFACTSSPYERGSVLRPVKELTEIITF